MSPRSKIDTHPNDDRKSCVMKNHIWRDKFLFFSQNENYDLNVVCELEPEKFVTLIDDL